MKIILIREVEVLFFGLLKIVEGKMNRVKINLI